VQYPFLPPPPPRLSRITIKLISNETLFHPTIREVIALWHAFEFTLRIIYSATGTFPVRFVQRARRWRRHTYAKLVNKLVTVTRCAFVWRAFNVQTESGCAYCTPVADSETPSTFRRARSNPKPAAPGQIRNAASVRCDKTRFAGFDLADSIYRKRSCRRVYHRRGIRRTFATSRVPRQFTRIPRNTVFIPRT